MSFPEFMFREKNRIPASQQNTPDIEGYYYTANDGSQMAFWIYKADRISKEHIEHFYGHLEIECEGHLGLTSLEYREQVESRKQEILDFCKSI